MGNGRGYRRGSSSRNYSNPRGGKMPILNGGRDARLSERKQNLYYALVLVLVALGFIAIVVTELTR